MMLRIRLDGLAREGVLRPGLVGVLTGISLMLAPLSAGAQEGVDEWQRDLQRIGEQLISEEYPRAEEATVALSRSMADQIVGGTGADLLLAMTATYRALAVAGQGRGDEAVWHWQVAQQLFPRVREIDLARFGAVGGFLRMHEPRRRPGSPAEGSERPGVFVPPRKIEAPLPDFPDGRAFRGLSVDVVVQVVVGEDGVPREPLVLDSRGEHTLVWSALEALRRWRFEPARRDGEPEAALYKLTVSFVVPEG